MSMRGAILALPILALGGCISIPTGLPANVQGIITEIETATQTGCGFLPTAETVEKILASFNPAVAAWGSLADVVAQSICSTVKPAPVTGRLRVTKGGPSFNGIPIHGQFVK